MQAKLPCRLDRQAHDHVGTAPLPRVKLYIDAGKLEIAPISEDQFQQNGVDLVLRSMQHMKGPFWLGCSKEHLKLPDDLMAFVELRSTWARRGFFLPPTIVDAGFEGDLTFEILSYGEEMTAPVNQRFAHLIFARTTGPCTPFFAARYDGLC